MAKRAKPGELNDLQQRFVDEYGKDLNATQAAIRAGYSEKTARSIGAENLTKPLIAAAIAAQQEACKVKSGYEQDYVLDILKREAGFFGDGCSHSARISAAKLLGQHIGMFSDKLELTGKGGEPFVPSVVEVVINGEEQSAADTEDQDGGRREAPV